MQFEIKNLNESGITLLKISGETSILDIGKLLLNSVKLLTGFKSNKILVDITEEIGKFNLMDTHEIVTKYPQYFRKYKFAIVDRQENYEKIKMHETMALRRGFRMFGFTDETSAVNWLNGSEYNEVQRCTTKLCGIPNCTEADE